MQTIYHIAGDVVDDAQFCARGGDLLGSGDPRSSATPGPASPSTARPDGGSSSTVPRRALGLTPRSTGSADPLDHDPASDDSVAGDRHRGLETGAVVTDTKAPRRPERRFAIGRPAESKWRRRGLARARASKRSSVWAGSANCAVRPGGHAPDKRAEWALYVQMVASVYSRRLEGALSRAGPFGPEFRQLNSSAV
jgi:hypothetical protein